MSINGWPEIENAMINILMVNADIHCAMCHEGELKKKKFIWINIA
jgi:hypothetical protein